LNNVVDDSPIRKNRKGKKMRLEPVIVKNTKRACCGPNPQSDAIEGRVYDQVSHHKEDGLTYKIVLVGDFGVGKTSLLGQFIDNSFTDTPMSTVQTDLKWKTITIGSDEITLQLWDTAGAERFRSVAPLAFRNANGICIVFDISQKKSFDDVRNWCKEIKKIAGVDTPKMLIGNKCDLIDLREVSSEKAKKLADEVGGSYIETSAKKAHNVEAAFTKLAKQIRNRRKTLYKTVN